MIVKGREESKCMVYLEGHGDLVSRLILGIIRLFYGLWGLEVYLRKPHDQPSRPAKPLLPKPKWPEIPKPWTPKEKGTEGTNGPGLIGILWEIRMERVWVSGI